jgi:Tfp pilus assembly protein PilN
VSPDFSTRRRPPRVGALTLLLLLVGGTALAAAGYGAFEARAEAARSQAAVLALRGTLAGERTRLEAARSRRREGGATLFTQAALTAEAPPARVLAELSALLPPDARFENVALGYGARIEIDVQVAARDARAYDRLLERLSESPLFEDVVPGAESRDGEVRAGIRLAWRSGPAR